MGFHLAQLLCNEGHDVTIIESNPTELEELEYALDASTVLGNAASVMLLKEAGVKDADLFVAATGSDEINLIAAAAAKGLGAKQVVARANDTLYVESSILYEQVLSIDFILSPEALAALEIANYIETAGILAAEAFGRGLVQMRQIRVVQSPTVGGKMLKDICPPGCGVLLGMVSRNDRVLIPHGDTVIEKGDIVTLIGRREQMAEVQQRFKGNEARHRSVYIMGGSSIALYLAQALEKRRRDVKLFERKSSRCEELAAVLKKTEIVCRDVTSRNVLEQEHVETADVFVATTRDDERNIVTSVLAKEMGAHQSISVVHQPDFAPLVRKLGIDHAVTPRVCLADRVLKLLGQEKVSSLAILHGGQVEILEFVVTGDTPVLGKQLKDIQNRFPREALVATILRGDQVIVPGGEDEILAGDSVVVITMAESVEAVRRLFSR